MKFRLSPVTWFCLILTLIYSLHYLRKNQFDDGAIFGGDTWVYQSQAVNWVKGHGLKFGGIEDYDVYKFAPGYGSPGNAGIEGYYRFMEVGQNGGIEDFFSTPGVSLFFGLVYKIFGIHPQIARQAQLILLIITAGFLPYLGFHYWKKTGLVGGIIGGYLFLQKYASILPKRILSEPLIVFTVFFTSLAFVLWQKRKTLLSSFLFGLLLSAGLLIKGSLLFIIPLFALYFLIQVKQKQIPVSYLIVFLIGSALLGVFWSVRASLALKKPTFLSTQGELIIKMGNNRAALDGDPHDPKLVTFYDQPGISHLPTPIKLVRFYQKNLDLIPMIFINKIYKGFEKLPFFKLSLALIAIDLLLLLIPSKKNKFNLHLKTLLHLLAIFLVVTLFFQSSFAKKSNLRLIPKFLTSTKLLFLSSLLFIALAKSKKIIYPLPIPFLVFFGNFLFMTTLTFGFLRYTEVIAPIFYLTGTTYALKFSRKIYTSLYQSITT